MLLPDDKFSYSLTDYTADLIRQLDLKPPRQIRFVGKISYTDQRKELLPDFSFCYEILALRDKSGNIQRRPMRCPDLDMNQSR